MKHDPNCSGCPKCDPEMRAALAAFTRGDYPAYCQWLTARDAALGIRTAAARGELRCGITYVDQEDDMKSTNVSYKEQLSRTFADLRAATRALEARPAPRAPRMRTLEDCVPPNPYAIRAAEERAECVDPRVWPSYDPYGAPPNGYAIALGLQQLAREDEGRALAATAPTTMLRDDSGVPDGYKTALAARRGR